MIFVTGSRFELAEQIEQRVFWTSDRMPDPAPVKVSKLLCPRIKRGDKYILSHLHYKQ